MKAIHSMIAALGLAFVPPAAANAAVGDPETIIYRFPGVHDDGGVVNNGVATVFHCTNFSGVTETLRFATRDNSGILVSNSTRDVGHLKTATAVTHANLAYSADVVLFAGPVLVDSGTTAIAATSINVICTAMTIDAANAKPTFAVSLRGIRFNPAPGSQE